MSKTLEQNPEKKNQALPTLKDATISHDVYNSYKTQRKNVHTKKKQLQETVSYLRRQAQNTNRKLNQTQSSLLGAYEKKTSNLEQYHHKLELYQLREKKLDHQRNLSSLSRYLNSVKRQQAKSKLEEKKRQICVEMRNNIKSAYRDKKNMERSRLQLQHHKNQEMNQTIRKRTMRARDRSLEQKKKASKIVRSQLIKIEDQLKEEDLAEISKLEQDKQKLLAVLKNNKVKHKKFKEMKQQLKGMNHEEFEERFGSLAASRTHSNSNGPWIEN